jgi:unsaturated pyranuronate lyase
MSFIDLNDLEEKEPVNGFKVRFVHSDNMTTAYWKIDEGAELPEHDHPHEQVTNVIEGEFELCVEGQIRTLTPGIVAVVPSNATHSGKAVSDCRIIDVFCPVREDYR